MKIDISKRLIKYQDPTKLDIDDGPVNVNGGNVAVTGNITATGTVIASTPVSAIADPGNGGTITPVANALVNRCDVTTAGAGETRVLGAPSFVGQILIIEHVTDGGDFTVTIAAGHKDGGAADDVATFADAEDCEVLIACGSAATDWRFVSSKGVAFA